MSATVLVTGAGGLVGRAAVPLLQRAGHEVVPVSWRGEGGHPACDLTDPDATRRLVAGVAPDAVLHLAGGVPPLPTRALYERNVITALSLLEAASATATTPHVVVIGSAAEYGEPEGGVATVRGPLRPISDYGRAKAAQTILAEIIAERDAVPLTVVRPYNIVAPDLPTTTALGNVLSQLWAQDGPVRVLRAGRFDVWRDYVPLDFVAAVLARVVADAPAATTLDVCSGIAIELAAIVAALGRRVGVSLEYQIDPELASLPAPARVVGDPGPLLELLGMATQPSAESLADVLLGYEASTSSS